MRVLKPRVALRRDGLGSMVRRSSSRISMLKLIVESNKGRDTIKQSIFKKSKRPMW